MLLLKLFTPLAFFIALHTIGVVILVFTNLMVCLLIFMLIYMYFRSKREKNQVNYKLISDLLVRKAVFYDGIMLPETLIPVTKRVKKLIDNKYFRDRLTDELVVAKKNITGTSAENLKHLYQQLNLEQYALKNLKSRYWHIKAKAIQELYLMELKEYEFELYPFANDKNELIRMEAQVALVQFNGFEGLLFLDDITYSISEWQQIKLLQKLSNLPPVHVSIDSWLKSSNISVVIFALKLIRNYHRFELHDAVLQCLDHPDPEVRLQAINCFCEIYTDETSIHLISRFWREGLKHQLAIIRALQNIGSENDNPFLLTLLHNDNYEMKLYAARALAHSGKKGLASLNDYGSYDNKLNDIIIQVKGELAA